MIEAVIKIGGSLSSGASLPALCQQIALLASHHHLLIVPGGGAFADTVRAHDHRFGLSGDSAHWMAILAMDQYGYLLSELIPGSCLVRNLTDASAIAAIGRAAVILPFSLLQEADPLPHSWLVTSDSIAAWIAARAGCQKLLLLKDVDGLFTSDPKSQRDVTLRTSIVLEELDGCAGVDSYLSKVLHKERLKVWVLNGEQPERLASVLTGLPVIGTLIDATKT